MPAEIVIRLQKKVDRNSQDYYFAFPDIHASVDLEDVVILFFPGDGRDGTTGTLRIKSRDRRAAADAQDEE